MRRLVIATAMSLCVVSLAARSSADTLVMRDGTRVSGTVQGIVAQTITFKDSSGVSRRYRSGDVAALEFASPSRANRGTAAYYSRLDTLPSGTELVVLTTAVIDSATAVVNQTFSAIIEQDVINGSMAVIVPERSKATLVIREVSSGGTTGSPEMMLDIQSITVAGHRYLVSTTDLREDSGTGIGKNKRTAETIGGGAALGTLIGAIAGGGKGAAIGGLVGAAGGAGVEVLSKGQQVRVPAETILKFRLDKPVNLQTERQ